MATTTNSITTSLRDFFILSSRIARMTPQPRKPCYYLLLIIPSLIAAPGSHLSEGPTYKALELRLPLLTASPTRSGLRNAATTLEELWSVAVVAVLLRGTRHRWL